ncbi:MAG: glycoside hydrolase family 31 protein [Cyanobacteriota bacterium]
MNIFKQIKLTLRFIKFERFLGSLFYSYQRDRWERQFRSPQTSEPFQEPGKILQSEPTNRGAHFFFEQAELEISFLSVDLVRVDWKPGIPPIPYGIARQDWSEVETKLEETAEGWVVSSTALKVVITENGGLKLQNSDGQTLREELPPHRQGEAWTHRAKLRQEEHIYGLGERAASLDLRRPKTEAQRIKSYRLWHYDAGGIYSSGTDPLYLCIPVYLGLHREGSYLVFYENTYSGNVTFSDVAEAYFEGGALRYYLTTGKPAQLLQRYTELTGRPPLPPRWAFGYHQSRWGYETEEAVRETAQGFQTHDLPLSAIHLDIDCKDNFRSFTIDPDRFPKLREFNQELAAKGVRLIAIVNPGVKSDRNSKLFQEGRAQEVFCTYPNGEIVLAPVWPGLCAFPDFTNPLARHWWSRQYEYLLDLGVTGFWHDMNEPGVFTLRGDATLPRPTKHSLEGRGGTHVEAHNIYGLLQAQAGYEALCEYKPETRPFIVSRSGWAGLQRYAWTWTGDVETSWKGLRQTLPTVLGMGLSGIPYTGPDIGGFKGNPSDELYLRWFQMASFLTFCRTHSANNVKPRTPWSYGGSVLSIVREFLRLRYRLIPYFYTLAWEATQTGHPPIRPLFWSDPDDERLWGVDDAFSVGDALLVCPIVEEGVRERNAILPKGHWYNFWDDALLEGAREVNLEAPLEQIPLLVKAGSILPMEEGQQLILHLYPPMQGTSEGCLYSDAGDGYGEWRLDKFYLVRDSNSLELTWEEQGEYPLPYQSVQLHLHGFKLQQAWVDGKEVAVRGNQVECVSAAGGGSIHRFRQVRFQG